MVLMGAGASRGLKMCSSKEAETGVVLLALSKAKDWGFHMIHLFLDALEVISALNGGKDCALTTCIMDVFELARHFEKKKSSLTIFLRF